MNQINIRLRTDKGNHMPEATIGKENMPAPIAEPAVIIVPIRTDFLGRDIRVVLPFERFYYLIF